MTETSASDILAIRAKFKALYASPEGDWERDKPVLAHYTSITVAEKIIATETLWFSNPLYMNDHEELRWGITEISKAVKADAKGKLLAAAGSGGRRDTLLAAFDHYVKNYEQQHVLNVFASCWTQHTPQEQDGKLSMWRGYLPDRDATNALHEYITYNEGNGRMEPKLKLKVQPIPGVIDSSFIWDQIAHGVILGPGQNDPLSIAGFRYMLQRLGKNKLLAGLKVSGIPFRA